MVYNNHNTPLCTHCIRIIEYNFVQLLEILKRRRKKKKEEKEEKEKKKKKKKKKKRRKRRREFDVECTLHVSCKDEIFFFLFIMIFKLLKFYDNFIKFIIYNFVYVLWTYIVLCVDQTPSNL